jgi:hypothetical protein
MPSPNSFEVVDKTVIKFPVPTKSSAKILNSDDSFIGIKNESKWNYILLISGILLALFIGLIVVWKLRINGSQPSESDS